MTFRQVLVPFTAALLGKVQEVAAVQMQVEQDLEKMLAETNGDITAEDVIVTDVDPIFNMS